MRWTMRTKSVLGLRLSICRGLSGVTVSTEGSGVTATSGSATITGRRIHSQPRERMYGLR